MEEKDILVSTIQALNTTIESLSKTNESQAKTIESLELRLKELSAQVAYMNRQLFGRKSEKLQVEKSLAFVPPRAELRCPPKTFLFCPHKSPGWWGHFYFVLLACLYLAHALTNELYLMCSMNYAVKYSVCHSRGADRIIPARHRQLG